MTSEQIARLDREIAAAERHVLALREIRDAITGADAADELTDADRRELAELAELRAARMRRARAAGGGK